MIVRRWLPYVVAVILGVAAALLVSCGDAPDSGISADRASDLKSDLDVVRQRVDDARCSRLTGQLRQVRTRIDRLPESVDAQLRERLRDGSDKLRDEARTECSENRDAKEAETQTTDTQTTPEPTATQPPQTKAKPPPTATTAPPATTTSPSPAPQPQPPNPGGGTPPELQP